MLLRPEPGALPSLYAASVQGRSTCPVAAHTSTHARPNTHTHRHIPIPCIVRRGESPALPCSGSRLTLPFAPTTRMSHQNILGHTFLVMALALLGPSHQPPECHTRAAWDIPALVWLSPNLDLCTNHPNVTQKPPGTHLPCSGSRLTWTFAPTTRRSHRILLG